MVSDTLSATLFVKFGYIDIDLCVSAEAGTLFALSKKVKK